MYISAYGAYIPRKRIKMSDFASFVGKRSAGAVELAVPSQDDDSVSLAVNSAKNALDGSNIDPKDIDAIVFGTTTSPYLNKSTIPIIVEGLGLNDEVQTFELCGGIRTGMRSLLLAETLAKNFQNVLCVVSECIRVDRNQILDLLPSAGSVSFVVSQNGFAEIRHLASFCKEFLDIWSTNNQEFLFDRRSLRYTYEEAYSELFNRIENENYDTLIAFAPDVSTGARIIKKLKIDQEKVARGAVMPLIGNMFSVTPLLGLVKALEEGGKRILVTCCGSGGGDAVMVDVKSAPDVKVFYQQLNDRKHISVSEFLNLMEVKR